MIPFSENPTKYILPISHSGNKTYLNSNVKVSISCFGGVDEESSGKAGRDTALYTWA